MSKERARAAQESIVFDGLFVRHSPQNVECLFAIGAKSIDRKIVVEGDDLGNAEALHHGKARSIDQ